MMAEMARNYPDTFSKKFDSSIEGKSYTEHSTEVSNLKVKCRNKYMNLSNNPEFQEAWNRVKNTR